MGDPVVNILSGGMNTDFSPEFVKEGQHTFALNAVDGNRDVENVGILSNENSNKLDISIPNRTIIGKQNISDTEIALFLVNDNEAISEIATYNIEDSSLKIILSDEASNTKLNFKLHNWIDTTYRVRRGCLRTIYFTDGINSPRSYCIDTPDKYKDVKGNIDLDLLSFNNPINSIPKLDIQVKEGGNLKPGQYFVSIQYWNEESALSDWMSTTDGIIIYNTNTENIRDITGNVYTEVETYYGNNTTSSNSILVNITDLDDTYKYYKIAIACSYNNSHEVDEVLISDIQNASNKEYIFTGNNYISKGTLEDIIIPKMQIQSADTITQYGHRLILGGIKERDIDHSKFQEAANKIISGCTVKKIDMNVLSKSHPANKTHKLNGGVGYTPGEIYSFGIVYVFKDGSTSPVYHIPGISENYPTIPGTHKMSTDNKVDYKYSNNYNFWGTDYTGSSLANTKVRHHRFPTRNDLGVNVVDLQYKETPNSYYNIKAVISFNISDESIREKELTLVVRKASDNQNTEDKVIEDTFNIKIDSDKQELLIKSDDEDISIDTYDVVLKTKRKIKKSFDLPDGGTQEVEEEVIIYTKDPTELEKDGITSLIIEKEVIDNTSITTGIDTYILGIEFSNIELPESKHKDDIIGYFFVRNNREDYDKTILSSALMLPTMKGGKNAKYTGFGQVLPEHMERKDIFDKSCYALVYPEFLFKNTELQFNEIEIVGEYELERDIIPTSEDTYKYKHREYGIILQRDVIPGTTKTKDHAMGDDDGWDIVVYTRNGYPLYKNIQSEVIKNSDIEFKKKIGALDSFTKENKVYYNVTTDNKILLIKLKEDRHLYNGHSAKYVVLKNNHKHSYQNFLQRPYYKISNTVHSFSDPSPKKEYGGDNYTTPIHYTASNVYDIRPADRDIKGKKWWEVALYVLSFLGGIAITVFSGGVLAAVGGGLISLATTALFISSEIKLDNLSNMLTNLYKDGLRDTVKDRWVAGMLPMDVNSSFTGHEGQYYNFYGYLKKYFPGGFKEKYAPFITAYNYDDYIRFTPHLGKDGWSDDTVIIFSDTLSNIFFDSPINTYLRVKSNSDVPDFAKHHLPIENSTNYPLLFYYEGAGKKGREYIHTYERPPQGEQDKLKFNKIFSYNQKENKYDYRGLILSDFFYLNRSYENIKLRAYYSSGDYSNSSKCENNFPYRIIWSEVSREEDGNDNYLKFLSNNYKDLNAISGNITNLVAINQDLIIHTDKYLFKQPANYNERVTGDMSVYIGSGEFMANPAIKIGYIDDHYYLGLKHKLYSTVSSSGYYFVANDGNLYRFDSNLDNLSKKTPVYRWFVDNIQTENNYNNGLPWLYYGSGILVDSDNRNDRILITCKQHSIPNAIFYGDYFIDKNTIKTLEDDEYEFYDYKLPFIAYKKGNDIVYRKMTKIEGERDKEFTISYNILNGNFVSFHSYIPDLYLSNGYNLFSYRRDLEAIYRHNIKNTYQTYYNKLYPFIVEFSTTKSPYLTSTYEFIKFKTVAIENIEGNDLVRDNVTFNKALFYNSYQCSDIIDFNSKKEQEIDQYTWMQITDDSKYNLDKNELDWSYNYIRNTKKNYNEPIFKNNNRIINSNKELVYTKIPLDWSETEMLRDKYMITRLIFDDRSNIRLKYIYNITDYINSER